MTASRAGRAGRANRARMASKAKRRLRANRLILASLVLVALAGLYGVAGLARPVMIAAAAKAGPPGRLPVTTALLGCPAPGSGGTTGGGIAVASAPAAAGSGSLVLTPASQPGGRQSQTRVNAPRPGQLTVASVREAPALPSKLASLPSMAGGLVPTRVARGGLIVAASGSDAQGLDVEQLGPDGQPTARCQAPGSDFWFLSSGAPKLHVEVYLLNADAMPADANVSVQTDSGPVLGTPDSGIVIPPHGMVVQSMDRLLHAARAFALHVTTSTGRVVAAVRETDNAAKAGTWLPASPEPATSLMLPGLPSSPGTPELYLAVPGGGAAQVRVTAVTPRGSYQPTGGNQISMLGHLTTGIAIPSLGGIPGSIQITANVPVTAVLESSGGPAGAPGMFVGGSGAIGEQGVVAASPAGAAGKAELLLAAPRRASSVRIAVAAPGQPLTGTSGKVVRIKARSATLVWVALPKGPRGSRSAKVSLAAIVVTPLPGSGPVYAARLALVGGSVQTVLPVLPSPTTVRLPQVRESLLSVLG